MNWTRDLIPEWPASIDERMTRALCWITAGIPALIVLGSGLLWIGLRWLS